MKIRINYEWQRDDDADGLHPDYQLDYNAPEFTDDSELKSYLKTWAQMYIGHGFLKVNSVKDMYDNTNASLAVMSDKISGLMIRFDNGVTDIR